MFLNLDGCFANGITDNFEFTWRWIRRWFTDRNIDRNACWFGKFVLWIK
jgi:hypothetical protein